MEIGKTAGIKQLQINKKLNLIYNKKKNKKEEKGVSFADVLKLESQRINF